MTELKTLTIEEDNIEDEKLRPTGQQTDLRSPSGHSNSDSTTSRAREVNTMEDVIERLRLSKQAKIREIEDEGRMHGIEWANHHAEYDELRRMAQLGAMGPENHEGAEEVFKEVTERELRSPDDMADFYRTMHPMVMETATYEFVSGFIEGGHVRKLFQTTASVSNPST